MVTVPGKCFSSASRSWRAWLSTGMYSRVGPKVRMRRIPTAETRSTRTLPTTTARPL